MSAVQGQIASERSTLDDLKRRVQERRKGLADTTLRAAAAHINTLQSVQLRRKRVLRYHAGKIYALDWAPDNVHLLTAAQDGHLIVWNTQTGNKVQAVPLRHAWVMACAYAPSGQFVASGGLDNTCTIYNLRARQSAVDVPVAQELVGHLGFVSSCAFRGDREILTASGDKTCVLWDLERGTRTRAYVEHSADVLDVSWNPSDPNLFVTGSCDARALLWDARVDSTVQSFAGHRGDVNSVDFMMNGQAFATGSEDGTCRLFDLRAGALLNTYAQESHLSSVSSVALSHSGRMLFSAREDGKCFVWDTLHAKRTGVLSGHDAPIACLGVSANGRGIATGGWDARVLLWGA